MTNSEIDKNMSSYAASADYKLTKSFDILDFEGKKKEI